MITQGLEVTIITTVDVQAFADAMERIGALSGLTAAHVGRTLDLFAAAMTAADQAAQRLSRMHTAYRARTRRRNRR